jgi:hypothetical protein
MNNTAGIIKNFFIGFTTGICLYIRIHNICRFMFLGGRMLKGLLKLWEAGENPGGVCEGLDQLVYESD